LFWIGFAIYVIEDFLRQPGTDNKLSARTMAGHGDGEKIGALQKPAVTATRWVGIMMTFAETIRDSVSRPDSPAGVRAEFLDSPGQ
jgi:hypothetical protein